MAVSMLVELGRTEMPWLLKAEPNSRVVKGKDVKYTIDDLEKEGIASWDGVRNNEARKHLASMQKGDMAFFYRSNCSDPGIVGTMQIVKEAHPDATASDPNEPYYDAKNPEGKWVVVDVKYVSHIEPPILLSSIKANPKLHNLALVRRSRLSVSPVTDEEWQEIIRMGDAVSAGSKEDSNGTQDKKGVKRAKSAAEKTEISTTDKEEEQGTSKRPPRRKTRRRD